MDSVILRENNFEKARKEIRKNRGKYIIFSGDNDELNRKVIEKEKIDVLLVEQSGRRDFSKQRDSGFNQVMAKAAKKSGTAIGICLDEILKSRGKEKSQILARIRQNIVLCNRDNLKMKLITKDKKNERSIRDFKALGLVLGMPTWMVKEL